MEITSVGPDDEKGAPGFSDVPSHVRATDHARRLRLLVDAYINFVGRLLRNMGIVESDIDDAVQQVFIAVSAKLDHVETGRERAFVFGVVLRTAARMRRDRGRRREVGEEHALDVFDPSEGPEQLSDQKKARAILDQILSSMDTDLRTVFALYEIEELTMSEISDFLAVPPGTIASRLRRARDAFGKALKRLQAKHARGDS